MADTIAAIATAAAPAGLGVVRLSGADALAVAQRVFRPAAPGKSIEKLAGYTAAYGHVQDNDGDIDDCIALVFRAPHSYTGENVVEFSCHGGLYLLRRVLRACLDAGARPAEAGEFTRRAFLHGKMDLTQAENVMSLIAANGRLAARTALAAREGSVYRRLEEVKAPLLAVAAQFAAFVDYPDEDIPQLEPAMLAATIAAARESLAGMLDTFDAGRVLREGIDTVIVGSPNVGKSTLMNCLAGFERSIVTDIAGTTRDVVEETVRLGDVLLRLSDTAGIREGGDEVESAGITRARRRMTEAALVLAVFDGERPLTAMEKELCDEVAAENAIAIINKADRPLAVERDYLASRFPYMITLSAKEGTGLAELTAAVADLTGVQGLSEAEPVLATERQRQCVARCIQCLTEAAEALAGGMTLDAVSVSLDGALAAILELTGERATEAVVDEVFARFCVGK